MDKEERSKITWVPSPPPVLDGIKDIELDCETTGLKWWDGDKPIGIAIRLPNGQTQYIPWGHKGGGNLDEKVVKRWAQRELRGKRITNLNTKFDIHQLLNWGINLEEQGCEVSDVGHYAALLDDHRRRFSLEILSQDYLKEGKEKGIDASKMAEYHAGEVDLYARQDVHLVGRLKNIMWPMLEAEELQRVRSLEDRMIFPTVEMERNGSPLNGELLEKWSFETKQSMLRTMYDIHRDHGIKFDCKKKDFINVFKQLDLIIEVTPGGQNYSFTDAILKKHAEYELIQLVRRVMRLKDLRSKFIEVYKKNRWVDGRIGYSLHQLRNDEGGTVSGRYSSSKLDKNTGINIQQVMAVEKQIDKYGDEYIVRDLFVPAVGQWLSADAAQIEYRLFAHFSNSKDILKAYEEDPTRSFHILVWDMLKPFKADILYKPVKNLNFAKIYGAGLDKISDMLGLPRAESDKFVAIYDKRFPEATSLLNKAANKAKRTGFVKTILGRRSRFPEQKRLHKALNAVIQGSAADIMKQKHIELHEERKKTGFIMRLTNHDEVCGDSPDEACTNMVKEILNKQSFSELKVPILWDVVTGTSWGDCGREEEVGRAQDHVDTVKDKTRGGRDGRD